MSPPRNAMLRFWPRLLKAVLPVTLLCGAAGYLYAVAAGAYFATDRDDGGTLRDTLTWRVPFFMAVWGGGFTLLVEWFRHLWAPAKTGETPTAASPDADAEQLLLQLLEQAERAEQSRAMPMPTDRTIPTDLTDTPPPNFPTAPVPDALEQRA